MTRSVLKQTGIPLVVPECSGRSADKEEAESLPYRPIDAARKRVLAAPNAPSGDLHIRGRLVCEQHMRHEHVFYYTGKRRRARPRRKHHLAYTPIRPASLPRSVVVQPGASAAIHVQKLPPGRDYSRMFADFRPLYKPKTQRAKCVSPCRVSHPGAQHFLQCAFHPRSGFLSTPATQHPPQSRGQLRRPPARRAQRDRKACRRAQHRQARTSTAPSSKLLKADRALVPDAPNTSTTTILSAITFATRGGARVARVNS